MDILSLFWGSVVYRPYVYAFFVCFVVFSTAHLGWKRALTFTVSTWLITYLCEYSSTRNGFPFGPYSYFDQTRDRELWISNVPFWDSLSFVFLSYFSFVMAAAISSRSLDLSTRCSGDWPGIFSLKTPILGGLIMMLLDVVIDPITLQGEKWFLGKIYEYPYQGFYFGVTAANFAGWFFVGLATQLAFQFALKFFPWCRGAWRVLPNSFIWGVYGVYAGVFFFNLAITLYVGDLPLALSSALVSGATLVALYVVLRVRCKARLR